MKFRIPAIICGLAAAAAIAVTAHAADTHSYSVKSGIYDNPQFVWITADENTDIFYTTDGSLPSDKTTPYVREIPIILTESTRIRCAAYQDGKLVENSALTVKIRTAKPSASKDGGCYSDNIRVKLTCPDEDAVIRYTTDGSNPTEKSRAYSKPLLLKSDTTLRFAAFSDDHAVSRTVTEEYNIGVVYAQEQRQALFELVNRTREQYGLAPLEELPQLSDIAQLRAKECAVWFSHYRPDGTKWDSLLAQEGLRRSVRAENIAYYYPTAKQVLNNWMNSTYHRANILSPNTRYIGIGYYDSGSNVYWTQIFLGEEE